MIVEVPAPGTVTMPYREGHPSASMKMVPATGAVTVAPGVVMPTPVVMMVPAIRPMHMLVIQVEMGDLGHPPRPSIRNPPILRMGHCRLGPPRGRSHGRFKL